MTNPRAKISAMASTTERMKNGTFTVGAHRRSPFRPQLRLGWPRGKDEIDESVARRAFVKDGTGVVEIRLSHPISRSRTTVLGMEIAMPITK